MSRAENLISPAADKVAVKLIYQHLINPGDSARCHAVQKQRPFFSSRQRRRFTPLNFGLRFSAPLISASPMLVFFSVLEPLYQDIPHFSKLLNELSSHAAMRGSEGHP